MSENVIEVRGVGKKFSKSLKRSMLYGGIDMLKSSMGMEVRSENLRPGEFWAVDDVSFDLKRGETLGIIGPNGSGKSTLLKMLNGIFLPDKGSIKIQGRVGALIQVGAGFHALLSGRENIYINGAILGMSKREIDRKFDSIVAFADIGDFLDSPVNYYSSGMFVRLGFAVAIHCEPDILLVDEILAVGDGVFQKKCFQKIEELRKKGVSIILVSHSLLNIERVCRQALFLNFGVLKSFGESHKVLQDYQEYMTRLLQEKDSRNKVIPVLDRCTKEIEIKDVYYIDKEGKREKRFTYGEPWGIRIFYKPKRKIESPIFQISLMNWDGAHVATFGTHLDRVKTKIFEQEGVLECRLESLPILFNNYYVNIGVYDDTHNVIFDYWDGSFVKDGGFEVKPDYVSIKMAEYTAICHFKPVWEVQHGGGIKCELEI